MTEPQQDALVVRAEIDTRINFASQQNDVPVVKVLHVENLTDEAINDVQVRISAEPDFCQEWKTHITTIPAGGIYSIPAVDFDPPGIEGLQLPGLVQSAIGG